MNILRKTTLGLTLAATTFTAKADSIDGVITFAGVTLLNNANSALATQATVFSPTVIGVAGDFSPGISVGDTPAFTSLLVLGATPATIWTVGGFTFTPSAPLVGGGGPNNTFAIGTTGIVDDGPGGFDPTPAIFSVATTPTIGGLGAFASITAAAGNDGGTTRGSVPDSGGTLMLLGAGLAFLGTLPRIRKP